MKSEDLLGEVESLLRTMPSREVHTTTPQRFSRGAAARLQAFVAQHGTAVSIRSSHDMHDRRWKAGTVHL
jgi:hypothetical protein